MQFHIPRQSKDTDIMAHNTIKQHVHMNTDIMLWMTLSLYECVCVCVCVCVCIIILYIYNTVLMYTQIIIWIYTALHM